MIEPVSCPLCKHKVIHFYHKDKRRSYWQCQLCNLVFVVECEQLDPESEHAEYCQHENNPSDMGYRRFLSRLHVPLAERLAPESTGLDFGSGPGPTLSVMFEELGHRVDLYDKFFANNVSVFERQYDFITATEVLEHLSDPQHELNRLWRALKPDGYLGVMTKLVLDVEAFSQWHYKNDPTHICFYSIDTLHFLKERLNAQLDIIAKDTFLFKKNI